MVNLFRRDNISTFSTKRKTAIDSILTCKGIVFIYSDYLTHGVKAPQTDMVYD